MHKLALVRPGLAALALATAACTPLVTINLPAIPTATPSAGTPAPTASPVLSTPTPVASGPTTWPSEGPSWLPTVSPTWNPNYPNGTPSPFPSAPCCGAKTTILSGTVFDEVGAPVDGAIVRVTSLDASVPYTATTTTSEGSWVVNNIPEGANVEMVATKDGWTSRRRVGSFQTQPNQKNIVDFGGTGAQGNGNAQPDMSGLAYFISRYPEIAYVDPGQEASNVDNTTVSYKLTLSEPLDATNQNRFANAIRLFPANQYAAPDNDSTGNGANYADLRFQKPAPFVANGPIERPVDPDPTQGYAPQTLPNHPVAGVQPQAGSNVPWDYAIKNGTLFLNDANTRANVTWDATGTVATLTFNAPLIADRVNQARYHVGLVATSSSDRIVDKDNNQLGLDAKGSHVNYPLVGTLIHSTIKDYDLALNVPQGVPMGGDVRWTATHLDAARFAVKVDNQPPKLVSVAYTRNLNQSSRFELTFSEPMGAYNGRAGGHVDASIRTGALLEHLSMVVSSQAGGTAAVPLGGNSPSYSLNPANAGNFADDGKQFWLGAGTSGSVGQAGFIDPSNQVNGVGQGLVPYGTDIRTAEANPSYTGKYLLAVAPTNPRTLFIYVVGRTNVFDPREVELKVRAEKVGDPAGNLVSAADADAQQVTGVLQ